MKLLALGDTHGDINAVQHALAVARKNGCDTVVQVGDFGFGWEHTQRLGKPVFQQEVNHLAAQAEIDFFWLDGNHENHDQLEREVDTGADTPQQMGDRIWYLPRASTWSFDGLRCMALGGAYSIDKHHRVEGHTWWPQEMITNRQACKAMDRGRVDIMFTHDAPEGFCPIVDPTYKSDEFSAANRRAISAVVEQVHPRLLIHGHYHHRYTKVQGRLRVEGLGRDGDRERSWLILDSDEMQKELEHGQG